MNRPIVLPELPERIADNVFIAGLAKVAMQEYARAAVEADRKGIVVTDEDVARAVGMWDFRMTSENCARVALEDFAKRLRSEE